MTYATSAATGSNKYFTATDNLGNTTRYTIDSSKIVAIKRPVSSSDDLSYTYSGDRISQVNSNGDLWSYAFAFDTSDPDQTTITLTVTDPLSAGRAYFPSGGQLAGSDDGTGQITRYQPLGEGKLGRISFPEGNAISNTFDTRGNPVQIKRISKGGTPLPDIIATAIYPETCSNPLICNKPISTTDARGNVTEYTYDPAHGGLLTVTRPAPAAGAVRPQTRYSYTSLYAWYKNAAGTLVQAPTPIWRLTGVFECRTLASCAGAADESKTVVAYGSPGAANNLLPTVVTTGAGDGSLTAATTFVYDAVGNRVSTDGPLAGSADTTVTRYDANSRAVGMISPDPDGAGALPNLATRLTYNADGQVILAEQGSTNGQTDSAWAGFTPFRQVTTGYDAKGRKVTEKVQASGTTYAIAQYSYDARDRATCLAQRMNPIEWSSLPLSACTAQTPGSFGPDRISQTTYDAADRVLTATAAFGTPAAATDSASYNHNGTLATATDAKGNRTGYLYDAHDRLIQFRYPSPATAGTSSTTDYASYVYDATGNLTSLRKRDGRTMTYSYDALNRVILKTVPDGSGLAAGATRDVYYDYDLADALTKARFDSIDGDGLSFGYNALGQQTTETSSMGGVTRMLTSNYDAEGARIGVTHPDGQTFNTYRDGLGRLGSIYRGGVEPLVYPNYDNQGRLAISYRLMSFQLGGGSWAMPSSYGYDPIGRLASLAHGPGGGTVTTTFGHNPAGQITTLSRSNDAYAWNGYVPVNRTYAANGLNQYTTAGPASFTYDANGNLTADGTNSYSYDVENRLVSASNGAQLNYDPLGRLWDVTKSGATTRFVYDGDRLTAEYDAAGSLLHRYVHGDGADDPQVWYDGPGTTSPRYLYADHLGSIVAIANASGAVGNINTYDEYGIPAANNVGRFQYTGQAWLPELGMFYYKARMYSPTAGRFMQTDPIGYADGSNLYAYVRNDPINLVDPSGLQTQSGEVTVVGRSDTSSPPGELGNFGGFGTGYFSAVPDDAQSQLVIIQGAKQARKAQVYGALRQNGNFHYKVEDFAFCSADSLFAEFRKAGNSAPGAPAAQPGTTTDIPLTGNNPITQIVDSGDRTITNITQSGHRYHSGTVEITITPTRYGSAVTIVGRGTTPRYLENRVLGKLLFIALATRVTIACTKAAK